MKKIEIIRAINSLETMDKQKVSLFSKIFYLHEKSESVRIIIHEDFPLIKDSHLDEFIAFATKIDKIVVSGCEVTVHPYRLIFIDEKGFGLPLVNIPQSIRGSRQLYPKVFNFIPALIAIPPNTSLDLLQYTENFVIYLLPKNILLDKSLIIERLLIKRLGSFC